MEEFKGTKKVFAVEYAGAIFINEGPHYEDYNALDMLHVGDEVAWANAKLYEAAPDLLEALSEFMKYHESDFFKLIADDGRVKSAWVEKSQKAINKAIGK